jgi:beta-N-acetylhexosaminidase
MKAVERYYSEEEIPVLAVLAGADCLLVCHNHERQQVFIKGLKTAVKKGVISEKRIQESFDKIMDLKNRFVMPYQKANDQEALKIF